MNYSPSRRKRPSMRVRVSDVIRCPGHLKWVRGHECSIARNKDHECEGRVEAHHVETRGSGGGDETAVPLCSKAHAMIHTIGRDTFAMRYRVSLENIAKILWLKSPHRLKHEQRVSV